MTNQERKKKEETRWKKIETLIATTSASFSRVEPHLGCANVKHGQHVLQKHIAQNVRPRSTAGDANGAVARQRVDEVLVDQIGRVDPELDARDDDGKVRRDGVAGRKVRAPLVEVDGARLEGVGNGLGQGWGNQRSVLHVC